MLSPEIKKSLVESLRMFHFLTRNILLIPESEVTTAMDLLRIKESCICNPPELTLEEKPNPLEYMMDFLPLRVKTTKEVSFLFSKENEELFQSLANKIEEFYSSNQYR